MPLMLPNTHPEDAASHPKEDEIPSNIEYAPISNASTPSAVASTDWSRDPFGVISKKLSLQLLIKRSPVMTAMTDKYFVFFISLMKFISL
jgi:hypothetical protein